MAQGYLMPASLYVGGAAGNLSVGFYSPNTNTTSLGNVEGIQVVASLGADSLASLGFITPNPVPGGTPKLRSLFQANISVSSVIKYTVKDGNAGNSLNPGSITTTTESQDTVTWSTADIFVENKRILTGLGSPNPGDYLAIGITFNTTGWTLAQILNGVHMLVWE